MKKYTWKDIIEVNGKLYAMEFPISGDQDDESFNISDFIHAVTKKFNVDPDSVKTYMMDGIDFDPEKMPFGAEDCGCYIDGIPEWTI